MSFFSQLFNRNPYKNLSFNNIEFLVLDCETTGLNPNKDRILSWASVSIEQGAINLGSAQYHEIEQKAFFKSESASIHGILSHEGTENEKENLILIHRTLKNRVLVGHHIGFDWAVIKNGLKKYQIPASPPVCIDTFNLAVKVEHGAFGSTENINKNHFSLDALCNKYEIKVTDRHTAFGDTFATALLFLKLCNEAQKQKMSIW
jgi:DNA polymerase-3 subunit epsilon